MFITNDKIKNPRPTIYEYRKEMGKDIGEKKAIHRKLPHHIQRRNLWIVEDRKEGMSLKDLAEKYGLKPGKIFSILKK